MFVNLETSEFRDAIHTQSGESWNAITVSLLHRNERNVAIGRVAAALQWYASDQPKPADLLSQRLYELALRRVDFYSLALELVQTAETADPASFQLSA